MRIGYITHRKGMVSRLGATYLDALKKYTSVEHNEPTQPKKKLERRGRFNEFNRNGEMNCDAGDIIKKHMEKLK